MRIGILTFWKTEDNYGQLLQCYATQTYLRSIGHETFLVKAINGRNYNPTLKEQFISKLRTAYRLRFYPIYLAKRAVKSLIYTMRHGRLKPEGIKRGFEEFRNQYLNCTESEYTLDDLIKNPPVADAFVVGSDQIWNTDDGIYFLSWADDKTKKISIAASFGAKNATKEFTNLIAPWLKRFDLITVRENSGVEICKEAGIRDVNLMPDPTLLLRDKDYLRIASGPKVFEPYIFIYFLGTRTDINWKEIHQFAKRKGLKIIYVGSQGQEDKFPKVVPSIEGWLHLMANAEYVITNSFHGTVFALQFHKRFIVYPVKGAAQRMNGRLTTLLDPIGLSNRIYNGNLSVIDDEINFQHVFEKIDEATNFAKRIFNTVLE